MNRPILKQSSRPSTNPNERDFTIDPKYADDLGWVSIIKDRTQKLKADMPPTLKKRNLTVNETKTEEFEIGRDLEDNWKEDFKYLGSLVDTANDIQNRKTLANAAFSTNKNVFNNNRISKETKIRVFNAYVSSIFLYNSELWSLNKDLEHQVDVFQRNLLRRVLQIFWPKKITNEELYRTTKQQPWSVMITKRRLSWLGHLMRLDEKTPARKALEEYLNPCVKRPRGRPPVTWMSLVRDNLKTIDVHLHLDKQQETIEKLIEITSNRSEWRRKSRKIVANYQNQLNNLNQSN